MVTYHQIFCFLADVLADLNSVVLGQQSQELFDVIERTTEKGDLFIPGTEH